MIRYNLKRRLDYSGAKDHCIFVCAKEAMIGLYHIHFDQIDSTNEEARRMIAQGDVAPGTMITADFQTNGRGQHSRQWHSQVGQNAMMSLILRPIFLKIQDQYLLNVAVSLAVLDTIEEFLSDRCTLHVKWPNDIYINRRKAAGILIQNYLQGQKINYSIIGIGINVLQKIWPNEVPHVTSLAHHMDTPPDPQEVTKMVCNKMEQAYHLMQVSPHGLLDRYNQQLLGFGQETKFATDTTYITGKILGIDLEGRIKIMTEDGPRSCHHGEVRQVIV